MRSSSRRRPTTHSSARRWICQDIGRHARRAVRERLHNVIPAAARSSLDVEEIVVIGKPHHEILRVADEWRADLVVLGMHGRNVVDQGLFGSAVEPVVRRAHCPVLTVRGDTVEASAAA